MRPLVRFLSTLFLVSLLSGCASQHFSQTDVGKLSGKLTVQWLKPDTFLFIPDAEKPLTFTRANGDKIQPEKMYTDGGSIPRPLWAIKSYSPWGYAPAFIVHDWLFEMKHCDVEGNESYDVFIAGQVMSEVIKTLMKTEDTIDENKLVLYSMHKAVTSKVAQNLWDNGSCDQPIVKALTGDGIAPVTPKMEYVIEFP